MSRTEQRGLSFYGPAPEVEDPFELIPGGVHHICHVEQLMHWFLPVDPSECGPCRDRIRPSHGCTNGHYNLGMCDVDRGWHAFMPNRDEYEEGDFHRAYHNRRAKAEQLVADAKERTPRAVDAATTQEEHSDGE